MIKASDLRIGNYVNYGYCVQELDFVSCGVTDMDNVDDIASYISLDIKNIKPIPLTEEWFLKFGAVKEPYEDDIDFYYLIIRNKKFDIIYENEDDIFCDIGGIIFKLKYVHELQNLYHALTSNELKYNKDEEIPSPLPEK